MSSLQPYPCHHSCNLFYPMKCSWICFSFPFFFLFLDSCDLAFVLLLVLQILAVIIDLSIFCIVQNLYTLSSSLLTEELIKIEKLFSPSHVVFLSQLPDVHSAFKNSALLNFEFLYLWLFRFNFQINYEEKTNSNFSSHDFSNVIQFATCSLQSDNYWIDILLITKEFSLFSYNNISLWG